MEQSQQSPETSEKVWGWVAGLGYESYVYRLYHLSQSPRSFIDYNSREDSDSPVLQSLEELANGYDRLLLSSLKLTVKFKQKDLTGDFDLPTESDADGWQILLLELEKVVEQAQINDIVSPGNPWLIDGRPNPFTDQDKILRICDRRRWRTIPRSILLCGHNLHADVESYLSKDS